MVSPGNCAPRSVFPANTATVQARPAAGNAATHNSSTDDNGATTSDPSFGNIGGSDSNNSGADDNGATSEESENNKTYKKLKYAFITGRLHEIELELGCPSIPDYLTDFASFSGEADDYPWREWVCSTEHRVLGLSELSLIEQAELLVAQDGSAFGTRLRYLRDDNPDLLPVGSGFKIFPWLMLLREETGSCCRHRSLRVVLGGTQRI